MRALLAALVLCAGVAHAADAPPKSGKWKLLVLDVKGDDLEKSQADTLTAFIASRAARFPSLDVVSSADIRDLVTLEANKQQAGCDETSASCLAEVAGAMGAELVLSTRAGKLDGVFLVSMQLFDARVSSVEGRASVQGWSLAELPEKMSPALDEMLAKVTGEKAVESKALPDVAKKPPVEVDGTVRTGLLVGGGVGAGVGVVTVVLGAVPALLYSSKKDQLTDLTSSFGGTAAEVKKATELHKGALADKELYNGVGRWAVAGGALVTVLGGAAIAGSFFLPGAE